MKLTHIISLKLTLLGILFILLVNWDLRLFNSISFWEIIFL